MTPEARVAATLRSLVRSRLYGIVEKLAPTHVGMPDILCLLPGGEVHLIELKSATGQLRPAQQAWHDRAGLLDAPVTVLRGTDEVRAWVEAARRRRLDSIDAEIDEQFEKSEALRERRRKATYRAKMKAMGNGQPPRNST